MVGDVTVVGLDPTTTVLRDIRMDVPHRVVVTIPADLATISKDLWLAISQRRLFQLHAGATGPNPVRPTLAPSVIHETWQDRCRYLESENAQLKAALQQNEPKTVQVIHETVPVSPAIPAEKLEKLEMLDEILSLLKSGALTVAAPAAATSRAVSPTVRTTAVVDVDVPAFIPTEIKPKDVEGRIVEVQSETSTSSTLGSAANALRQFRKKQ